MTLKKFIKKYEDDCHYYFDGYYSDCVEYFLTKIFNDHEAEIKAKDEEIEGLEAELIEARKFISTLDYIGSNSK